MNPGAHRIGTPAPELVARLIAERTRAGDESIGLFPHHGPISDKIRPLAAAGQVGAQLVIVEDEHSRAPAGDGIAAAARRPWFRRRSTRA